MIPSLQPFSTVPVSHGPSKSLSIIAYNIQMLPLLVCAHQRSRINFIAPKMEPFDIVVFSEAFDKRMVTILIKNMEKIYPYYTRDLLRNQNNANNKISVCQNGGVLIFSKYEIIEQDQKYYYKTPCEAILNYITPGSYFRACKGSDCLAQKGVVYAKILKNNFSYHIFASHLQASYKTKQK